MYASHTSHHLHGTEKIRLGGGGQHDGHDSIYVEDGSHSLGIVLSHGEPAATRVAFLRNLAETASTLADEINVRDLEAVSDLPVTGCQA